MKSLGFLLVGFVAGYLVANLSAKVSDERALESPQDIQDQISDKLDSLERSLSPA